MGRARRSKTMAQAIIERTEAYSEGCETFEVLIDELDPDLVYEPFESAEHKIRMLALVMAEEEIMRVGEIEAAEAGYSVLRCRGNALTIRFPRDRARELRGDVAAGRSALST